MILPEWSGETCFIVACGPSLSGFNAWQLKGRRVIVINDSFELVPWADILYFCDLKWWQSRKAKIEMIYQGRRIVTLDNKLPGIITMRRTGQQGLETDPAGLRDGRNSGYQAINLAYHLGASRICLLGYDMKVDGERMHWNARPEHQNAISFQQMLSQTMLPHFETLKKPLEDANVEVVNCTPNSNLKVWPFKSLQQVLNERV